MWYLMLAFLYMYRYIYTIVFAYSDYLYKKLHVTFPCTLSSVLEKTAGNKSEF